MGIDRPSEPRESDQPDRSHERREVMPKQRISEGHDAREKFIRDNLHLYRPSASSDSAERRDDKPDRPEDRHVEQRLDKREVRFIDVMPGAEHAEIDPRKFRDFSMDPGNESNGGKHKAWEQLGYNVADENVRDELSGRMTRMVELLAKYTEVAEHKDDDRGCRYKLRFHVDGASRGDRDGTLVTAWLREHESEAPRLITNWVEVHTEEDDNR